MRKNFYLLTTLLTALFLLPWSGIKALEKTVADATNKNEYVPIYGNWADAYERCQVIYPASLLTEMNGKQITSMKFYFETKPSGTWTSSYTFLLSEVSATAFSSAAWNTEIDGTVVYENGTTALDGTSGELLITFTTPFFYSGGNLMLEMQDKSEGSYKAAKFYGEGQSYSCAASGYSQTSFAAVAPTLRSFLPKTTFTYEDAPVASCPQPKDLTTVTITTNSASFTWSAGGSETSWKYICLPAASSVDWTSGSVQTASTASATISNLDPNTSYKFYVRSDCGSEQSSVVTKAFTTPCGDETVPYSMGFEASEGCAVGSLPSCWNAIGSPAVYNYYVHGGSLDLRINGNTEQYVILPRFSQPVKGLAISFWYKNYYPTWYPSTLCLGTMTDPTDKTTFTQIGDPLAQTGDYVQIEDQALSTAPVGDYYIAFKYTSSESSGAVLLDDISVNVASTCTKPTNLSATASSPTSANVSWTAGGSETKWDLQYRVKGTSAWTAVTGLTSASHSLSSLTGNTTYEIQVQADCGGDQSGWTASAEVHTPCDAVTIFPWTEDFAGVSAEIIPDCWDNSASTCTLPWDNTEYYIWGTYTSSGNTMLRLYSAYINADGYAVINTPLFTLPNANDFQFLFDYSHKANCGAFKVKMSVDGAPFADLGTYTNEAGTTSTYPGTFTSETIDLSSYNLANKTIQFQFYAEPNYGNGAIFVDNIKVRKAPTCFIPSGLTISNVGSASANLSWTAGASETNWKVQYKADGAGSWTDKAVSGTPSCSLTGLNPTTTYYVQVIADCGAGDYSEPTAQNSFTTTCAAEAMPFEEEFSSSTMPDCWIATSASSTYKWYMDYQYVSGAYNYYVRLRTGSSGTATLQLPAISLTENAVLKFKWKSASSPVAPVSLYISTDGGTTKTEIPNNLSSSHSDWTDKTYDLSAYTGNTVLIYFISTFSSTNKYAYLDDIQVIAKPCDLLTNVNAVPTVDGGTISWTGDAKKLQYRAGTSGAWTSVTITDANKANPHTLTGLASSTAYQVRALSICGDESDEDAWTAPISFTTKCAPSSALPYENNFESETAETLPSCWHKVTTNDDYPQVVNGAWAYGGSGNYLGFSGTEEQIAVLPAFTAPLNTLTIQFYYRYHYADFQLGYVKADGATFVALETLPASAAYGETPYEMDLSGISSDAVYLAFRQTNATGISAASCVDNLVVKATPACAKPTSLAVSAITAVGATFTWSASGKGETQYQYCIVAKDAAPSGWTLLG